MKKSLIYAFIIGMMAFSPSCKKKNSPVPEPTPTGCVKQVVEVGSSIDVATTWDSCHIYHCANFLGVNAALTIEAGTVVKFDALKGILVASPGTLTVDGNAGHPVIFTSIKDDSYG